MNKSKNWIKSENGKIVFEWETNRENQENAVFPFYINVREVAKNKKPSGLV